MRLQLTAALAALVVAAVLPSADAVAQRRGDTAGINLRTSTYLDDDRTFIQTSTVAARVYPGDELTLTGRYLVDVTTTASVDVVTAATGRFTELRHEAQGGVGWGDGTRSLSADYVLSTEPDWVSHSVLVGGSHDLAGHDVTLSLGGSYVDNRVGRAGDDDFERRLRVVGVTPSLVFVVDPRNLVAVRYAFSHNLGYQASPYRFARFRDPDGRLLAAPERHPELRLRHAVAVAWNHAFDDAALRTHLRGYVDDWGIVSATGGAEYVRAVGDVELGVHVRGYVQRGASFYDDEYPDQRAYMTADRELSTFVDLFAGAGFSWRSETATFERLAFDLKLSGFVFHFPEFAALSDRIGLVAELGFGAAL